MEEIRVCVELIKEDTRFIEGKFVFAESLPFGVRFYEFRDCECSLSDKREREERIVQTESNLFL